MQVQSIPVSSDVPAYNTTYKHIKDNSSTYMYIHVYTYICTCTSVCCIGIIHELSAAEAPNMVRDIAMNIQIL